MYLITWQVKHKIIFFMQHNTEEMYNGRRYHAASRKIAGRMWRGGF
jgi:hypothetical protein